MNKHSLVVILCLFSWAFPMNVPAQEDDKENSPANEKDFKRAISYLQTDIDYAGMLHQKITTLRESYPNISNELWSELTAEIDSNKFYEAIIRVHKKYLTDSEVSEIIKFYESPAGMKLREVLPQIKNEILQEGTQTQSEIVNELMEKLKKRSYSQDTKNLGGAKAATDNPAEIRQMQLLKDQQKKTQMEEEKLRAQEKADLPAR